MPTPIVSQRRRGLPHNANPQIIQRFDSDLITIAANDDGSLSFNNVFESNKPDILITELVCISDSESFLKGERIPVTNFGRYDNSTASIQAVGITFYYDTDNNLKYNVGQDGITAIDSASANTYNGLTIANFKLYVGAIRFVTGDIITSLDTMGVVPLSYHEITNGESDHEFNISQYGKNYEFFKLFFLKARGATDDTNFYVQIKQNGSWVTTGYELRYDYNGSAGYAASRGALEPQCGVNLGVNAGEMTDCEMTLFNLTNETQNPHSISDAVLEASSTTFYQVRGTSRYNNPASVSDIRILMSSGNLGEGGLLLCGFRRPN